MERLLRRVGIILRDLERLGQPEVKVPYRPRPMPRPRATIDWEGVDAEPVTTTPSPAPRPAPPVIPSPVPDLRAALGSRAALRQAFFLREILGPPRALQDPRDAGRGGWGDARTRRASARAKRHGRGIARSGDSGPGDVIRSPPGGKP